MKRLKKEVGDADEVKVKRRLDENLQGSKEAYINKGMEATEGCKDARDESSLISSSYRMMGAE